MSGTSYASFISGMTVLLPIVGYRDADGDWHNNDEQKKPGFHDNLLAEKMVLY
jgi:hypothetical protein